MNSSANPRAAVASKALEYVGLVAFTIVVPRVMGPEDFGTFSALLALVGLFTMMTGLGANTTFGRFIPEYVEREDRPAIELLFTQMLAVRVAMVVPLGVVLVVLILRLLPDVGMRAALMSAGAFMAGAVGMTGYQLQYGLNRLGRALIRGALSRLLLAAGVLALSARASPETAITLLFAIEAALGLLGVSLVASFARLQALSSGTEEIRKALRFGGVFFGATLLLTAVWRGGEIAVTALAESREEIAFYSLASMIAMALSSLLGQVSSLLLPSVTRMHLRGESERFEEWMAVSLRYVTLLAVMGAIGIFMTSDRVLPIVLGEGFEKVSENMKILGLGLVPLGIVRSAKTVAVVNARARDVVLMGAAGLGTFVLLALVLVPLAHSIGASIAVSSSFLVAASTAVFRMELGSIMRRAMYWRVVAPGAVIFMMLIPGVDPLILGTAALTIYTASAFGLGVLRVDEIRLATTRMTGTGPE